MNELPERTDTQGSRTAGDHDRRIQGGIPVCRCELGATLTRTRRSGRLRPRLQQPRTRGGAGACASSRTGGEASAPSQTSLNAAIERQITADRHGLARALRSERRERSGGAAGRPAGKHRQGRRSVRVAGPRRTNAAGRSGRRGHRESPAPGNRRPSECTPTGHAAALRRQRELIGSARRICRLDRRALPRGALPLGRCRPERLRLLRPRHVRVRAARRPLPHFAAPSTAPADARRRMDQLRRGDLVFFDALNHVGIYVGSGRFIHAPQRGTVVQFAERCGQSGQARLRRRQPPELLTDL